MNTPKYIKLTKLRNNFRTPHFAEMLVKIHFRSMLFILLIIYSACILLYSCSLMTPIILGDGHEYLGMTVSFFNHLSPELNNIDNALRASIEKTNSAAFSASLDYAGYFKSLNGDFYSFHFWSYPLFNLPVFSILHYLRFNELRTFSITNSVLLIVCLFIIVSSSKLTDYQKLWLFLFSVFNPVLLYIGWSSPEIYSYAFVLISLVFALEQNYQASIIASSIASLQNPPIILLNFYLIFCGYKKSKLDFKNLFYLILLSSISIIPYLFYYYNYKVPNLIVSTGSSSINFISFNKLINLFLDPNCGLFPYIPLLFVISLVGLLHSFQKRESFVPSIWFILVLMAIMVTTIGNWNSGMMYINRYSVWMIPFIIVTAVHSTKYYSSTKKRNIFLLIALMSNICITGILLSDYDYTNCVRFNTLSNNIMVIAPKYYNPPYELFVERSIGHEVNYSNFNSYLPIVFTYDGEPRKILYLSNNSSVTYENSNDLLFRVPIDETKIRIFYAYNGRYLFAEGNWSGAVNLSPRSIREFTRNATDFAVALRANNGQYVCAEVGGGRELVANRDHVGGWETFGLVYLGNNSVALRACNGQYVSAEGENAVVANSTSIGLNETFGFIRL